MRPCRTDQSGSVAVFAAVFIAFAAIGIAALAIDGGALFQTQRSLVTNTDAMALAGAGELAEEGFCNGSDANEVVEAAVEEYRVANEPDLEVTDIEVVCNDDGISGSVRVTAGEPSDSYFSGRDDLEATGWTEVSFDREVSSSVSEEPGEPGVMSSLAFCEEQMPSQDGADGVEVWYSPKDQNGPDEDELCDGPPLSGTPTLPGGWGWLEKADGSTQEELEVGDYICASVEGQENWCKGDPGNNKLQHWEVVDHDGEFFFPIFDEYSGTGGGEWHIVAYGIATLEGCSESGNEPEDGFTFSMSNCKGTPQKIKLDVKEWGEDIDFPPPGSPSGSTTVKTSDVELYISDVNSR